MDDLLHKLQQQDEDEEEEWYFMCLELPGKVGDKEVKIPVHLIFEGIGDL